MKDHLTLSFSIFVTENKIRMRIPMIPSCSIKINLQNIVWLTCRGCRTGTTRATTGWSRTWINRFSRWKQIFQDFFFLTRGCWTCSWCSTYQNTSTFTSEYLSVNWSSEPKFTWTKQQSIIHALPVSNITQQSDQYISPSFRNSLSRWFFEDIEDGFFAGFRVYLRLSFPGFAGIYRMGFGDFWGAPKHDRSSFDGYPYVLIPSFEQQLGYQISNLLSLI